MPKLFVIAGPNGAGKTTFAREYFKDELRFEFVNADEIARKSNIGDPQQSLSDIQAGRMMLEQVDKLVDGGVDFAIETTLASLTYARKIFLWQQRGYSVTLMYLGLNSVNESLARIRKRVEVGGHNIPEETVRRRFQKSSDYFEKIYKPIVNDWFVYESSEGLFILLESGKNL